MTSKLCPIKRHCFDKGTCETCELGKAFESYNKKLENLKKKNKKLEAEKAEVIEKFAEAIKDDIFYLNRVTVDETPVIKIINDRLKEFTEDLK